MELSESKGAQARFFAVVPAAGVGARMGLSVPKQYMDLCGRTMISRTLEALAASPRIAGIAVVVSEGDGWIGEERLPEGCEAVRRGGATRAETVRNGLAWLALESGWGARDDDWVMVHDAARPFVSADEVERLEAFALETGEGAILAAPMADTVKMKDGKGFVAGTIDRDTLCRAATPQLFRLGALRAALAGDLAGITDEASAIERAGGRVGLVMGSGRNFKVTSPADAELARALIALREGGNCG